MDYYKPFQAPDGISPVSETPSAEKTDLLSGVPVYGIIAMSPIGEDCHTAYFNTPEAELTVTNGVRAASLDYMDPAFSHFTRGTARALYYKLNNLSAVSSVSASFLYNRRIAIRLPDKFDVYLSENGKDWQCVCRNRSIVSQETNNLVEVNCDFGKTYKASWVRIEMGTSCHVWMETLSLYGTTLIPDDAVSPVNDGIEGDYNREYPDQYPDYSVLDGIKNIWLAYNCMPPDAMDEEAREVDSYTVEEALPLVGYYNKEGKLVDTFFDSALLLPYSRFTYGKYYKSAEGWKYYIDNTFAEGKNVDAFEKAVGIVSKELNVDFKLKLFFSVFHTDPYYGEFPEKFGDLDGDGIDEDLTTLEGKLKVTKWMIDTQIARFKEKNYENLEIAGFYWFEEDIGWETPYECDIMKFVADYVHSLGYKYIWIPYYQASGYTDWKDYKFDIANMQPNYAFSDSVPVQRLYDNAELTKHYGMGYELEINKANNPLDCDKYKEYLQAGIDTGFMHTVKMYYQDCRAFWIAYNSDDEFIRSVYDDTYLFAKEKLVSPIRLKKD